MLPVSAPLGPPGPVAALHYPYLPPCSLRAVCADRMHHGNLMTAVHYGAGLQPGSLAHAARSRREAVDDVDWGVEVTLAGTGRLRDLLSCKGCAWSFPYYCQGSAGINGVRGPWNKGLEETVCPQLKGGNR